MKHNYLKHLFTALLLLCTTAAFAHDFEVDGIYYNILSEEEMTVEITYQGPYSYTYENEYTGSVVIPQNVTYGGVTYSVTSIGGYAFSSCDGLTSIEIPNSVTSIGGYAFQSCDGLTSIEIPNGVTSIAYAAFRYCSGLTSIEIPNSVTRIGEDAFYDTAWYNNQPNGVLYAGKALYVYKGTMPANTSIVVKDGTLFIADNAFSGCSGLTSITIPNSVTSIGEYAFNDCTSLTSIEIPNSVTSIGYNAFWECSGLKEVHISDVAAWCGIDFVYSDANPLYYAKNLYLNGELLTGLVIPDGVKEIKDYAFYKCTSLTSIEIPNSVTSIGEYAFFYCPGLTSIEIPNSVTSISDYAFYNCIGLASIVIPNSVTSIGEGAFYGCSDLKEAHISDIAAWCGVDFGDYYANPLCNAKNLYLNGELLTGLVIPDGVKEIKDYAFYICTSLTSIEIPNSVTSIGSEAFYACSGLTSVVIGNSVTSIGSEAFYACSGLTSVVIGNSVTSIGEKAFDTSSALKEVHISDIAAWCGIDFGDYYANPLCRDGELYLNGELLTELVIPDSVKEIRKYAFYNCSGITSVTIPNSVTSIGSSAFEGCYELKNVTIGNSVTSIGTSAFYNCSGITSVTIPNSVTSIGTYAFYCKNLKTVINFSNITFSKGSSNNGYIAYYANKVINVPNCFIDGDFAWHENEDGMSLAGYLGDSTELTLPTDYNGKSVTRIGGSAFKDCSGLTSIVIPNSVTSIGKDAFLRCNNLTSVELPSSLTIIEEGTFSRTGLIEVTIPEGVTSLGKWAFDNCPALSKVSLPTTLTSIGENAFENCTGLTSITIPNSVTSIGDEAFYGCIALKTVINDSELDIGIGLISNGHVAYYANKVIKFELVDGVYTLVKYESKGAEQEEVITFNSWTSTNKGQSGSTSSYKYTFDATAGSKLSFDWSVSSEANYDKLYVIFDGTTKLTKSGVYSGNYEHTFTVTGSHTLEVKYKKDGSGNYNNDKAEIHNVKLTKTVNKPADVVLPDNYEGELYVIGESAFENNEYVASVTIPECVEMICDKAFSGCINLENIVIPNSVSAIGGDAFAGTKWYDNEEDGIVYAGNVLYKYKGTMPENTAITINDGTLGIAGLAFANCTGLTCIEIPASVTNIGNYAFDACTGLTSITSLIPAEDLFAIDSSVFSGVDKNACTLCVPYGAKETYAATAGWNVFVNIVELAPTDITVTINQYGNATYCSPFALDFSNVDGLKAYAATGYKSNSQVVTLTRVQTAKAGIGLFLKAEPGEYVVPVIESTDEHSLNLLVGTLEQTTVNSTEGEMSNYKFTVAELDEVPMFYPFEDNTTFSAGKAYLQIPTAWLPATAQKSLSVRFDDGETTEIYEVEDENEDVKTVYDLQGRVVENPTSGIYIIDGRKVLIK